jgi:pimeloyl-ACP methyl ester carboxylesterase
MPARRRVAQQLLKTFLPIVLVVLIAFVGVMAWLVYGITRPPRKAYLITPQTFSQVTGPVLNAKDETWNNHDGTKARGWLIRGAAGAPAVILLHRYGTDRSWLLNLAVKLNESTNFTVLWPDLRGHGENPLVSWTMFGAVEGDDTTAAIEFLRSLKSTSGKAQVGGSIGLYGVEMGAYSALDAATRNREVLALVLDSVPASPDDIIRAATNQRATLNNGITQAIARWGVKIYSFGKFQNTPACELAQGLPNKRLLLLAGEESDPLRPSTAALANCFPHSTSVDLRLNLPITGFNLAASTGEQEERYDRPVIEFFDKALR